MTRSVRIGAPICLAILGAILYFALNVAVSGVNLSMIGVILMVAGGIWFFVELFLGASGRKSTVVERSAVADPSSPTGVRTSEREVESDIR